MAYIPVREQAVARKTSQMQKSRGRARAQDTQDPKQSDHPERLRPILALSELVNNNQIGSALSAQEKVADQLRASMQLPNLDEILKQAKVAGELINNDQIRIALSAQQKVADQLRASMQLPNLDEDLKQSAAAAGLLPKSSSGVISARDLARIAASTNPASIEHEPGASVPLAEQVETRAAFAITCAHDLGQLVRKEREKRKLSQQAFADLAGVGRRFISELENGKATLEFDKVLQVALAVGIDVLARRRQ